MFLSIIIPVYNLENYITNCLESCLNQNFEDYEIICVNDGSKDNSAQILDDYAQKHPEKIRVIHKENGGVSSARNIGIKNAKGKWLWCVDGDDFIAPNCVSVMANNVFEDDEFIMFDLDKGENIVLPELTNDGVKYLKIEYKDVLTTAPSNSYGGGASVHWFRKDILENNELVFDERMRYSEDVKLIFQYKLISKNGGRLFDNIVYFYRERPDSAMHKVDYQKQIDCMKILVELYHNAMLQNEIFKDICLFKLIEALQVIQFNLLFKIRDYKRTCNQVEEWIEKGIYPYKVPRVKKEKLKKGKRGIKSRIVKAIKCCFGNPRQYLFLCRLFAVTKIDK